MAVLYTVVDLFYKYYLWYRTACCGFSYGTGDDRHDSGRSSVNGGSYRSYEWIRADWLVYGFRLDGPPKHLPFVLFMEILAFGGLASTDSSWVFMGLT